MGKFEPVIPEVTHILHGADYNPEQWIKMKDTVWKEDMRLAKEAGVNILSIGIFSWSMLEPEEGIYDFSWLDEVMDMLAANGIKADLATPSGARPVWMAKEHPEVLRVEKNGVRNIFGGRHNACLSSPYFRRKVTEINTRLAERYKDHPALGMWHISNEYGGSGDSSCYCPYCRGKFREFLKEKYGTLEALNDAYWTTFWSHRYTDWEQIDPPMDMGETTLHALKLDWHRFTTWQYIDFFKLETEPIRRITPDRKCTANFMNLFWPINYFDFAKELDMVSWDNYPLWRNDEKDYDVAMKAAFMHDMFRSLKRRPFMLMESCPSAVNWQPVSKIHAPGAHLSHSLQAVAHGSDTVQYFQFRKSRGSSEKFHGAIVDHEGHGRTRIFREICETGKALGRLDEVVGTTVPAKAALLFDWENWWAYQDAQFAHNDQKDYDEIVREYFRPLWEMGIPVDIVDEKSDLNGYDLLITPLMYMIREGFDEKIRRFVAAGGTWLTTCITGYVNETDLCYLEGFPGPLKDVLGIWEEELDSLYPEDENALTWQGKTYRAWHYCGLSHILEPTDEMIQEGAKIRKGSPATEETIYEKASVEAVYEKDFYAGYPAITRHPYGKGQALYVAARMESAFYRDFLDNLVGELGLARVLPEIPYGVEATVRTDGKTEYVFLNNYLPREVEVKIGEGGESLLSGQRIGGEIRLPAKGVEVFRRD